MFVLKAAAAILRTKWYPNAAEWARHNRILPNDSAEPGPFKPERTPYMLPIYEAMADPKTRRVVIMMATQMGKTDFLLNVIGESADTRSQPILFVSPTQSMAEDISKDRFEKMVAQCPSLSEKIAKGRKNLVAVKWIGGNRIGFVWGSSAKQLCSQPAGLVAIDERDRMGNDINHEGDPVELIDARTATYPNSKIVIPSTPGIAGISAIEKLFLNGTRAKWHLACLNCDKPILPSLEGFAYEEETLHGYLTCPHCKTKFYESSRKQLLARGQYIVENPQAKHLSFWVSGLCSPWRSWDLIAEKLRIAKKDKDPVVMKTCVNTVFGECFVIKGEHFTRESFEALMQPYQLGTIPDGVLVITCGVDVHKDNVYYAIRGWGKGYKSWLLDYGILYGETDGDEVWQKLDKIIRNPIGDEKRKIKISIRLVCIDCGYRSPFVYAYCRTLSNAIPCKGYEHQSSPIKKSAIEVSVANQRFKAGAKRFDIDDGYFKSLLYSRIGHKQWFIPAKVEDEYLLQVISEELVLDEKKGQMVWKEKYQNHYLDAEKLNLVAADYLRVDLLDSPQEFQRVRSEGVNIWQ